MAEAVSVLFSYAASVGLLGLLAFVPTVSTIWLLRLRPRLMRRQIKKVLRESRIKHYESIGLSPKPRRLNAQLRRESATLLAQDRTAAIAGDAPKLPHWFPLERSLVDDRVLFKSLFLDLRGKSGGKPARRALEKALRGLDVSLRNQTWRWSRWIAFLYSTTLAGTLGPSAMSIPSAIQSKQALWISDIANPIEKVAIGGEIGWLDVFGVVITAILASVVIQLLLGRAFNSFDQRFADIEEEPPKEKKESPEQEKPIGRDGESVRAINFSGGTFDTLMQLGVTHALLTIQGRAPDVVVGLSSGAFHAVALAEVMQKGEDLERDQLSRFHDETGKVENDFWNDPQWEVERLALHNKRMLARVKELRRFVEAAQLAPERLVDAILPDAYQVDSGDPLHPLEQPRFSPQERRERAEAVRRRSGLVRLYNDILAVPLSIGTIARFARRVLGFRAASEIKRATARWLVRVSEVFRLWVLLGVNLWHAAPFVGVLYGMVFSGVKPRLVNAGALIFRFRIVVAAARRLKWVVSFLWLLAIWAGLSVAFLFPFLLLYAFDQMEFTRAMVASPLLWLVIVVVWGQFAQGGSEIDRMNFEVAVGDVTKALLVFLGSALLWGTLLVSIVTVVMLLLKLVEPGSTDAAALLMKSWSVSARISAVVIAITAVAILYVVRAGPLNRFLQSYDLGDSLLKEHGLRSYLVELFDKDYYGKSDFDRVVEASLNDEKRGTVAPSHRQEFKTIAHYKESKRLEPIHVGIAVANVSTGDLELVSNDIPIVNGLLAAVSNTPFFPAVEIKNKLYVDGTNVTDEPTRALFKALRDKLNEKSKVVNIYSVSAFPLSQSGLPAKSNRAPQAGDTHFSGPGGDILLNLVDIALSSIKLQRFRDATLERRLTEVFSRVIPKERFQIKIRNRRGKEEHYFRAWVTPVELESGDSLTQRILRAPKEKKRTAILEAVADGCRASLQVMIPDAAAQLKEEPGLRDKGRLLRNAKLGRVVRCASAVSQHMKTRDIAEDLKHVRLPGSDPEVGPGLSEICSHCRLWRKPPRIHGSTSSYRREFRDAVRSRDWQHLRLSDAYIERGPSWPHEREAEQADTRDRHFRKRDSEDKKETRKCLGQLCEDQENGMVSRPWPRTIVANHGSVSGRQRHTVSFLFSGGVFRGVYQMGVLNALNLLELRPDVIGGASIGSITAAMVTKTFAIEDETSRKARIARLAAVYLAVDRLILTDRFADFVRDFTLRAAGTRFSIRQADRVFRKYDAPRFQEFDRNTRQVLAGIERLLYISPYQINELVRAFRRRDLKTVGLLVRDFCQQLLDRAQVGTEALGVAPLRDLIREYVTDTKADRSIGNTIDDVRDRTQIQLLATATNLTEGRLEVLGERPIPELDRDKHAPVLIESLLASSAFPGVFRPRWSWDLYPATSDQHQYVDGGVTDNLPIDAVAQFLHRAAAEGIVVNTPPIVCLKDDDGQNSIAKDNTMQTVSPPHLAIAVSLEVNTPEFNLPSTRREFRQSWPALTKRTKELRYNEKLFSYAAAETKLRRIAEKLRDETTTEKSTGSHFKGEFEALSLEVVAIRPEWLPSTFGIHPMLGFKRNKQAQSIAHGCASTIMTFARMEFDDEKKRFLNAWGIHERLNGLQVEHWGQAFTQWEVRKAELQAEIDGLNSRSNDKSLDTDTAREKIHELEINRNSCCWLLGIPCPFSRQTLEETNEILANRVKETSSTRESNFDEPIPKRTIDEMVKIHEMCRQRDTHLRKF